jgi:hypothetical protein
MRNQMLRFTSAFHLLKCASQSLCNIRKLTSVCDLKYALTSSNLSTKTKELFTCA